MELPKPTGPEKPSGAPRGGPEGPPRRAQRAPLGGGHAGTRRWGRGGLEEEEEVGDFWPPGPSSSPRPDSPSKFGPSERATCVQQKKEREARLPPKAAPSGAVPVKGGAALLGP
eukprot:6912890-Pyramimonas_sp.AAC.2